MEGGGKMEKHNNQACRVVIGDNYKKIPTWRKIVGVPIIYLPLFVSLPFSILGALLCYLHLKMMGAKDIKTWADFAPEIRSHRYTMKNQVVLDANNWWELQIKSRFFWIFNCTLYCPLSVSFYEWHAYLVKLVENWWCPFLHEKKPDYKDAPIDLSYWHVEGVDKLHPEDRDNPIWNKEMADKKQKEEGEQKG